MLSTGQIEESNPWKIHLQWVEWPGLCQMDWDAWRKSCRRHSLQTVWNVGISVWTSCVKSFRRLHFHHFRKMDSVVLRWLEHPDRILRKQRFWALPLTCSETSEVWRGNGASLPVQVGFLACLLERGGRGMRWSQSLGLTHQTWMPWV